MLALAPRAVVLGALLHAHPTARLAGPLLRRRASFMVEQSVSSSVSRFEEADSLLDVKVPQIDPGARDRTMVLAAARTAFMFADNDGDGFLDFDEVKELMQRMMGNDDPLDVVDEVKRMFCQDDPDGGCRSTLTYEDFVVLLNECSVDSALFSSLLRFGEDAVEAGVEERLRGLSGGPSAAVGRESSSHILDDGSPAWRESIEAAFDLCDGTNTGQINKDVLDGAVLKYPLIAQLLRVPVDVTPDDRQEYMRNLYDSIDDNHSDFIDRAEWIRFFCPDREAVPRPTEWDEEREDCHRITGFIFDCDGTIYQPDGLIPGAEDVLTWIEHSGRQYVLLSNTGALPYSAVYDKLSRCAFECKPEGKPIPPGYIYTAHDAQVDFMLSGHLPTGSRLLVLAPDERWKAEMRERMPELFDSWEIADDMDVDTAKEWSQRAKHEKVAIVFFHDGVIAQPWSYGLIHAMTILINSGADFIYTNPGPNPKPTLTPTPTLTLAPTPTLALPYPYLYPTPTLPRRRLHLHSRGPLQPEHRPALRGRHLPHARAGHVRRDAQELDAARHGGQPDLLLRQGRQRGAHVHDRPRDPDAQGAGPLRRARPDRGHRGPLRHGRARRRARRHEVVPARVRRAPPRDGRRVPDGHPVVHLQDDRQDPAALGAAAQGRGPAPV